MTNKSENELLGGLSREVIDYILQKIPPYQGLFVIRTDAEGIVKSSIGPWDKYLSAKPVVGANVEDTAPMLYGMVPPIINPMVISHLNIAEKRFADLHIFTDQMLDIWFLFIDQTRQVEMIHPIVQLFNQERLDQRLDKHHRAGAKETLSALYLLGFLGFELKNESYRQIGKAPDWFTTLKIDYAPKGPLFPIKDVFPYLEVFEAEAGQIWLGKEDGKLVSDIWQEKNIFGDTVYLQALALRHEKRNYLLIKPLDNDKDLNDNFLQKAREQKLTLDQLASTEKKLKELLGFKDQFISIISHDLRSPIGAIIGLVDLLLTDQLVQRKLETEQIELISDIKAEMFRLLDYNDKLFQWSNLELGNFRVKAKSFLVQNLANYVEKMQKTNLEQKQITFVSKIEPGLTINADETLLGQALNNLAGNSVKFTPPGGRITIKGWRVGHQVFISVTDSGVGMDQETADKLFVGFTRKSSIGTFGERGTGLGLGIVKKILDAHDYSIKVKSAIGKGSTFTITINLPSHA
ncbi:MAG TPA: HAMP domain-containing sensor histidine kinase [Bacteroidales bacterium]|nr:HAMP domain-containing sensor histidine kinase [Bacteroidales bacterium]